MARRYNVFETNKPINHYSKFTMLNQTDRLAFFEAQSQAFATTLASYSGREDMIDYLLSLAFSSFDGNVADAAAACPAIACHKGCATCCTLRVTATAPEILLIARYIHWLEPQDSRMNLAKRAAKANPFIQGLNEAQRVKLRRPCPFIIKGVCMIYPVRPLACRGHACYDKRACIDAALGKVERIPISEPHSIFRSLIQNAMQSALRDAGYAWASYELIQAVNIALSDGRSLALWAAHRDVFSAARIADIDLAEMGNIFDRLKRQLN